MISTMVYLELLYHLADDAVFPPFWGASQVRSERSSGLGLIAWSGDGINGGIHSGGGVEFFPSSNRACVNFHLA